MDGHPKKYGVECPSPARLQQCVRGMLTLTPSSVVPKRRIWDLIKKWAFQQLWKNYGVEHLSPARNNEFNHFVVSCSREFTRRSTLFDEDLSEVVDLSEHGTWANTNLCEIVQDFVDPLSRRDTRGHFAALEAVQKTAKERASETQRNTEQTREFTCRCLKLPRKNLDIRCRTV